MKLKKLQFVKTEKIVDRYHGQGRYNLFQHLKTGQYVVERCFRLHHDWAVLKTLKHKNLEYHLKQCYHSYGTLSSILQGLEQ